jgi:hypothetical protein
MYVTEVMTNKALKAKACELSYYMLIDRVDKVRAESANLTQFEKEVVVIMVYLSSIKGIYSASVINCFSWYPHEAPTHLGYLYNCRTVGTTQLDAGTLIEFEKALGVTALPQSLSCLLRKHVPGMQYGILRYPFYFFVVFLILRVLHYWILGF